MENNSKRLTVEIAGNSLSIVTDEPEEFVRMIGSMVSDRIGALTKNSFRISTTDAALLCAIEAVGDKLKAERRVRSLEAQNELYSANLKSLQSELDDIRSRTGLDSAETGESAETAAADESTKETIGAAISESTAEDKIRALEKYLESKKTGANQTTPSGGKSREEKIRYIESLLRGND